MSKVVRPSAFGGPEVLTLHDVVVPEPGTEDVVVEVRAAGVNAIDWKLYSGAFHAVEEDKRGAAGVGADLPSLGLECAGTVAAIGSGVRDVRVGDEVIVYPVTGAYAEYVVVPASSLVPKPENIGWAEAGGLMLAATTAAHALHAADVRSGDTVLVHGGSGAVGLMAVQMARAAGASVIATASVRNHDLLRELGATPVAYGDGLIARIREVNDGRVDAAIDTAGTDEALNVSLELVADRARIASITGSDRRNGTGIKLLGYGPGQDAGYEYRSSVRPHITELAASGELRVLIAATYPLSEAARAHELGQGRHAPGKIVLIP